MRTVLVASLRTHGRRHLAAAVAVVIGVSFVVTVGALSSATRAGLVSGVDLPYRQADVVVSGVDGEEAAGLVDRARQQGDRAAVIGWALLAVSDETGLLADRADVGAIADDPAQRWQTLEDGRLPRSRGEAVADVNAAKATGVGIGDRLEVGRGTRARDVTVVGLVDSPSFTAGASLYLLWDDLAPWAAGLTVVGVAYDGVGSVGQQVASLEEATHATVQSRDDFLDDRIDSASHRAQVLAVVLLLFAAVALFVSVLVIANTFSIVFAQRSRDIALLRCVGATRRQVLRSVRLEALCLGLVASVLGLLVGAGVGRGLVALTHRLSPTAALGEVSLSPAWLAGGLAVGLVVTLVASWLPIRRVVTVSPLTALRPDQAVDVRSAGGRVRIALGLALLAGGVVLLALAVGATSAPVMVAGGTATFSGVLLLGPLLVPALIRAAGVPLGRLMGATGRLATGNAVRHPRRTAATTASLLVGVTLTTAVLTGLASSRGAVDDEMASQHPLDVVLTSSDTDLPAALLDEVAATDDVAGAVTVAGATGRVAGLGELPVLAAPADADRVARGDGAFVRPGPGEVFVPDDALAAGQDAGDRVTVTVGGTARELTLRTGEGWGTAAVVAPATLAALTGHALPRAIWVRAGDGADPEDLAGDLEALVTTDDLELTNGLAARAAVDLQLDVLTASVAALLGIAVVIALIGIGNTLGLSVLERGREHALLRALGLTRRQLRGMLAAEAVLLSVVATLLGTLLGVTFAWVGVQAMVRPLVPEAPIILPGSQLALVVVVAAAAGLLACLLPARRAARTVPAAGLAWD
jgi:putative ABC transport system permease protein